MYKEAILCLMFATAEADGQMRDDELISIVTLKEVFKGYSEHDIIVLYKEYKTRFADKNFTEIAYTMANNIPAELYMGTLSIMADLIALNFDVNMKESSFIMIVASIMGVSDLTVKTLLLASLSKKLLMNVAQE